MAISFDSAFAGHDKFLKFRSDRAAVLANNIANADHNPHRRHRLLQRKH